MKGFTVVYVVVGILVAGIIALGILPILALFGAIVYAVFNH